MKRTFSQLFYILLSGLLFSAWSAQAADTFTLDPSHSYVEWHINHFGFSNPSGKWFVQGSLILDAIKPQNAKLNVTIPVADIVTGIPKLDEHLKSNEFFNTSQFPTATFVSDKVDVTGKNTAKVHGILTVHGVSKPIVLNVKLNKMGMSPITNKMTMGFTATTQLKRSDFAISAYLPNLSDEIKINIEAEAFKS